MATFLTLTRQFFLHTTPIDVINSWGISKMYATQIVKNVNGEDLSETTRWSVLPVKWALWDQALGTQGPSLGHRQTKRRAFVARGMGIQCPNVGRFLGTLRLLNQHDTEPRYKKVFCRNRRPYYFLRLAGTKSCKEKRNYLLMNFLPFLITRPLALLATF